jgi:putative transposase
VIVDYVDQHCDEFGVEPICRALQVAPSTYYAAKRRVLEPSARAVRDAVMMQMLMVLWVANRKVYGAHKLWKAARRAGHEIGRDQVARLMRDLRIEGVSRRRKRIFTTVADPDAIRAPDLVNRNFTATAPNQLWVTDLTYVPTRSGMAYVCFIVDAFSRRIVGWRVAANMKTDMVLDALEMARRSRGRRRLVGLVAHADAGSQGELNWSSQRLDRGGVDDDDARTPEAGAALSGTDPVAGRSDGRLARGPRELLGRDRARREDRCRCGGSARVIPRWLPVVPSRWRREPVSAADGVGPLSLLYGTRGDRAVAGAGSWRARDRSMSSPITLDDLAGAAPERVDADVAA